VKGQRGQAAVELVGILPLIVTVILVVAQLLAAGVAHELAGHAAEAGALAVAERSDPAQAVRDAVPGWSRGRVSVQVSGRRVTVTLRPASVLPGAAGLLSSAAEADAGPVQGVAATDAGNSLLPDVARSRDDPGLLMRLRRAGQ
jgi:hypothetical protein